MIIEAASFFFAGLLDFSVLKKQPVVVFRVVFFFKEGLQDFATPKFMS